MARLGAILADKDAASAKLNAMMANKEAILAGCLGNLVGKCDKCE